MVEKALVFVNHEKIDLYSDEENKYIVINSVNSDIVKQCTDLTTLKAIQALRLSYLYDGSCDLRIPPLDIFVDNHYKKFNF